MKELKDRKDELIERLFRTAQKQAFNNNFTLDRKVDSELIYLITSGINKLSASQLKDKETILLAERNIIDLIDLMSRYASKRYIDESLESFVLQQTIIINESLDISAFNFAMHGFCPRFPFC
jgi:hypothetical protein